MAGLNDPMRFIRAEEFFQKVPTAQGPKSLVSVQSSKSNDRNDSLRYGALLTFNEGSTCLFQFVTPHLWRIRFDPKAKTASDYPDPNTRTIVQDSFADLVDELQHELRRKENKPWNAPQDIKPDSCWATKFEQSSDGSYWALQTLRYSSAQDATTGTNGTVCTTAYFRKDPFQIQCTRVVRPSATFDAPPPGLVAQSAEKVIWQTAPGRTFLQSPEHPRATNIVFNATKPGPAEYIGFGEQGGRTVMKTPTLMNYFCYDNLGYNKLYNDGPTDPREPLYHSQPFFMEMNGTPGYRNVTATLIDNYSQVFIDLGKSNSNRVGMGVRFGVFDAWILCADRVPELIWAFTNIVGRPHLKPRYTLGHHQGGYGYMDRKALEDVVNGYRNLSIPLDGLHIDVDFQYKYRTFTIDEGRFPRPEEMFANFKKLGVKCCTNITPIISFTGYRTDQDSYPTINEAWDESDYKNPAKNFLIPDRRYEEGLSDEQKKVDNLTYFNWGGDSGGVINVIKANDWSKRKEFKDGRDYYDIYKNYNSQYPYHGGVSYGDKLGIPGFYPDLNRKVVREQFWAKQYEYLFSKGLEFVWQDMTTPAAGACYGDMLGFPFRLLISTDPYQQDPAKLPEAKSAMELWALYSYNLHKATYQGLQHMDRRKNLRNFIIGRGSSTGMSRWAGLWTGDNRSTWDFWRIAVAQVVSLGLGGISIAGVDLGGFFPNQDTNPGKWVDPCLLTRWYSGSVLLPWMRNHYMGKQDQSVAKLFQEVYRFKTLRQDYPQYAQFIPADQQELYDAVVPICTYYIRLRYSLMQALYDRMFENMINGLPIARSMLITDPDDTALFNEAAAFVDNQYLLGHYILVCPIMDPDNTYGGSRDIYLPRPNSWYAFNLRIDREDGNDIGVPLLAAQEGGSIINYGAKITSNRAQLPYMTPMYIREGAIIPQQYVRLSIGEDSVNPITLHVYPGKNNWYSMFLDDGVSRSSAPEGLPQYTNTTTIQSQNHDVEAKGEYREVRVDQKTNGNTRTITLSHIHNNYDPTKQIGDHYRIVLWLAPGYPNMQPQVTFQDLNGNNVSGCSYTYRSDLGCTVAIVPTSLPSEALVVKHSMGDASNGSSAVHVASANGANGIQEIHLEPAVEYR